MLKNIPWAQIRHSFSPLLIYLLILLLAAFLSLPFTPNMMDVLMDYYPQHLDELAQLLPDYSLAELEQMNPVRLERIITEHHHLLYDNLPEEAHGPLMSAASFVAVYLIQIVAFGIYWNHERGKIDTSQQPHISAKIWLLVCAVVVSFQFIESSLLQILAQHADYHLPQSAQEQAYPFVYLAIATLAAPLIEEILSRGLLFNRLRAWLPLGIAMLIQGAIFGIGHGFTLHALSAMAIGIFFAVLYVRSGNNMKLPIIAHMAANGLSTLVLLLLTLPAVYADHQQGHTQEFSFPFVILLLVSLPIFILSLRALDKELPPLPSLREISDPYRSAAMEPAVVDGDAGNTLAPSPRE